MNEQTDRELLELAAKAAGKSPGTWFDGWDDEGRETGDYWNPLNEDDHAFRLMVALRFDVCRPDATHKGVCVWVDHLSDFLEEPEGTDPYAATRRAIVRAAAALGAQGGGA